MKYALLIGINKYLSRRVRNLHGCVNDVNRFKEYLERRFGNDIQIKTLLNQDATRLQIIESFQSHLLQAEEGETVLFYFSGHGSQERSDIMFQSSQEDEYNETLVCTDSHTEGNYDLADKELKYLISLAANKGLTAVVIIDSCHSGSTTREADDLLFPSVRYTSPKDELRPLHTLVEGATDQIKTPKHILLAACRRYEKAREVRVPIGDRLRAHGIFTHTLLETLEGKNSNISYRDLIFNCESIIRAIVDGQTPIQEPFGDFDTFQPFLSKARSLTTRKSYLLTFFDKQWIVNIGLIHGLNDGFESSITFEVYADSDLTQFLGKVGVRSVGLEYCELEEAGLPFLKKDQSYFAVPLHLPLQPVYVYLNNEDENAGEWRKTENKSNQYPSPMPFFDGALQLVETPSGSNYELNITPTAYRLLFRDSQANILGADLPWFSSSKNNRYEKSLALLVNHIVRWERFFKLTAENSGLSKLSSNPSFNLIEYTKKGTPFVHSDSDITIDMIGEEEVPYALSFQNHTDHSLYIHLFYLDQYFGIYQIEAMKVDPSDEGKILLQDDLYLPSLIEVPDLHQTTEVFKIVVTQDRLKYFNPVQPPITELYENLKTHFFDGEKIDPHRNMGRNPKNYHQWYSQSLFVKLVRQLGTIDQTDWSLSNGKITIKGHPVFRAGVSLISTAQYHRGHETDTIIFKTLQKIGYQLVDFSNVQQLETMLELHHIRNANSLSELPLQIFLHLSLPTNEYLMAITLPADFHKDDSIDFFEVVGKVELKGSKGFQMQLNHIPLNPPDGRSIPNNSLKICFIRLTEKQWQTVRDEQYLSIDTLMRINRI